VVLENLLTDYISWLAPKELKMKAINPNATHEYTCKCDKSVEDEKTVFVVKYLTVAQNAHIRDELYSVRGIAQKREERILAGTSEMEVLRLGLKGWKNFQDELTGEEVHFDDKDMSKNLDRIPPEARSELADHIRGESTLSEGE